MIEHLTSALLASTAAPPYSSTPTTAGAIAPDVARFQAALNSTEAVSSTDPGLVAGTSASASSARSSASQDPAAAMKPGSDLSDPRSVRTLGDAILDGLKSSSNDLSRTWQAVGDVLVKPDPSVADMLRLQMMLVQATVQYELLGKTISKAAQNLDHVLRTQ